jgi:hypothetical protein
VEQHLVCNRHFVVRVDQVQVEGQDLVQESVQVDQDLMVVLLLWLCMVIDTVKWPRHRHMNMQD